MSMEQGARMWGECSWLTILFSYSCSCLGGRKMQEISCAVQLALKCEKKKAPPLRSEGSTLMAVRTVTV